ncbi:MAG: ComF family protein [Clostridia bacterium]|nr:ComF family protein [Clostridia bacterium]
MKKEELKQKALKMFNKLLDELFPENLSCFCCDEELNNNTFLCKNCLNDLKSIKHACKKCGERVNSFDNYCLVCKDNKRSFDKCVACFEYNGTAKKLIYKLKYGGAKYASKAFSKNLVEAYLNANFDKIDLLTCAPLSSKRLKQRGYNQAEVLAIDFCNEAHKSNIDFDCRFDLLTRIKHTQTQTHLTRKERCENLKDAFKLNCDKSVIKGKNILIVDDIFTTGATIEELAKVLKKNGAKCVFGLTVCHTILEKIDF